MYILGNKSFRCRWWIEKRQRDREAVCASSVLPAFSHSEYRSFTVTAVSPLTADSVLFTFSLQPGHSLGLAVGQHILLRCMYIYMYMYAYVLTSCKGELVIARRWPIHFIGSKVITLNYYAPTEDYTCIHVHCIYIYMYMYVHIRLVSMCVQGGGRW